MVLRGKENFGKQNSEQGYTNINRWQRDMPIPVGCLEVDDLQGVTLIQDYKLIMSW